MNRPEVKTPDTRLAWVILAAGFLILFVGGGARFAIGLTLKPLVEEFDWPRSQIGLIVGVFQAVSALAMFLAGRLMDRHSHRLILGLGLLLSALGVGGMSLISQPWQAMIMFGLFFGMGNGIASSTSMGVMLTRAFPVRTGMANGFVTSGSSMGQLVMIAILAAFLAQIGWRNVYVWLGLLHIVILPVLIFGIPDGRRSAEQIKSAPLEGLSLGQSLRTGNFWILLLIFAICGFDDFFVSTHVVAFANDRGAGDLWAGNLLAVMGLTAWVGVLCAGLLGDKFGPLSGTTLSFFLRILVFGLIAVDQSILSVTIFALVFGFSFLMTAPLTVLFVRQHFGLRHLGAISGLITMVHHICGGIGAYLGGFIFDRTGDYTPAFWIMFAASIAAILACLLLARRPNPSRSSSASEA